MARGEPPLWLILLSAPKYCDAEILMAHNAVGQLGVHPGDEYVRVNTGGGGGLQIDASPPRQKYAPEDRWSTGGRYAPYWNTFLFK